MVWYEALRASRFRIRPMLHLKAPERPTVTNEAPSQTSNFDGKTPSKAGEHAILLAPAGGGAGAGRAPESMHAELQNRSVENTISRAGEAQKPEQFLIENGQPKSAL